jgi:hypothetical protein
MPTPIAQLVLFTSSYSSLLIVFGLLDSFGKGLPSIICLVVAVLAILGLVVFMHTVRHLSSDKLEVAHAKHRDGDAFAYVATYLLPLLGFDTAGWRGQLALLIFVIVLAVLYLQSHLFYINPLLSLAGYRLFEAETPSGRTLVLISKRRYLRPRDSVDAHTQ